MTESKVKSLYFFPFLVATYLLARFALPYGDEPDWTVRSIELLAFKEEPWSPYFYIKELLNYVQIDSVNCIVDASPTSLSAHFSSACFSNYQSVLPRFLITLFVLFPLLALIFCKDRENSNFNHATSCEISKYGVLRTDALLLSLFFPGVIYYLGVFSPEQLSLAICLMLIVFYDRLLLVILLFALASLVDFGNALVFMLFYLYFRGSLSIVQRFGLKVFFISSIFLMLAALVAGYVVLSVFESYGPYLGSIMAPVFGKASAIFEALEQGGYADKYPVFLRPIITYMSSILLLPSGFKATFAILFTSVCLLAFSLLFVLNKTYRKPEVLPEVYLFLLCPVFFVCIMTFLIPNYAFAKYYIFTMPFILYGFLNFVSFNRCFIVILLINFFIIAELLYSGI